MIMFDASRSINGRNDKTPVMSNAFLLDTNALIPGLDFNNLYP
jgi:hypothetical protein